MSRQWPQIAFREVLVGPLRNGISPSTRGTIEERVLTLSAITGERFNVEAHKPGRFNTSPEQQYRVDSSDLLICRGNGNIRLVGRGFFPSEDRPDLVFPDTIIAARVSREHVHPRYLQYAWNSRAVRYQIESRTRTTNGTHKVNQKVLENVCLTLPPIDEQQRIAEVLDQADELRVKRRQAIALLDDLAQSIFLDMFGDQQSIFQRWPNKNLGNLLDFLTSGSRGWAKYYTDSPGDKFLRIQNIKANELILEDVAFVNPPASSEAKRTLVQPGDVILSITADLGRTAVIPNNLGRAFINQHLSILRTSKLNPHYLSAYLSSTSGQLQIHSRNRQGVKAGLNFDDIRSLRIPVPPVELQHKFVLRLQTTRTLLQDQRAHLIQLDALFDSLQQRAFRGEL